MRAKRKRIFGSIILTAAAVLLILLGCRNPLLNEIEDTVEIVITPPVISSIYPENGATDIPINSQITLTFSKTIDSSTATSSNVPLTDESGDTVSGSYSVTNDTVTFTPSEKLKIGMSYTVTITKGLLDTDGNSVSEEYSYAFDTGTSEDTVAPVGVALTINDNDEWATDPIVGIEVIAQDNYENVVQMNISNSNSFSEANWTSFSETFNWELSTGEGTKSVYAKFKDGAGNVSGSAIVDTIKLDSVLPAVKAFFIDGGKSATANSAVDIDIEGSDALGSSGASQFRIQLEGEDWQSWQDLTGGAGSLAGIALNVSVGGTQIINAQVRDVAGNVSSVLSETITYDNTPPSVLDVNWDDDIVFPYNGSVVRITFNEEMDPNSFTSGNYKIVKADDLTDMGGMINLTEGGSIYNAAAELWGLELDPFTQYKVTLESTATDIAGNPIGSIPESPWYFSTGDADDVSAPSGTVELIDRGVSATLGTLPSGSLATSDNRIRIDLSQITDDYNSLFGIKFWGDNSTGPSLSFEENVSWESWPGTNYKDWDLSTSPGTKFVLYKFMDSAGNESENPGQIRVILDNADPAVSDVLINNGDSHTNNTERKVTVNIAASDTHSGIEYMKISNSSTFNSDTDPWIGWTPVVTDWELASGNGTKTVYVKVKDYLDGVSTPTASDSIVLDLANPSVDFSVNQIILNDDDIQITEGDSDYYNVTDLSLETDCTYLWERVSGPGILSFNASANAATANNGTAEMEPYIYASAEGTYFIKVTVTDEAGNFASDTVSLVWDVTDPVNTLNVTSVNSNYVAPTYYSTTSQPTWEWAAVSGADFYRCSFNNDFANPANYTDTDLITFTPNTPLGEGATTLYVRAYDNAGNWSEGINNSLEIEVDTIAPVISAPASQPFVANVASSGVYSIVYDGTGGSPDGDITESGSGIVTVSWTGPTQVSFTSANSLKTNVSAAADNIYTITLTVNDKAGNTTQADFTLHRDITKPGTPAVTGLSITPSLRPTWYWSSGGGGIGVYNWDLDSGGWSGDVTSTSYQPPTNISGSTEGIDHTLSVREVDSAGNWSDVGSWVTTIDTDALTPPIITIGDAHPSLRTVNTMIWNVESGAGGTETNFRYRIDEGTWQYGGGPLGSPQIIPQYTGLSEGDHRLDVEMLVSTWRTDKQGSHIITVDTIEPGVPTVSGSGIATADADRTATPDLTPVWSWSGGGGGNGVYRYRLDNPVLTGQPETTATSFTQPTNFTSGSTHILYVQERDAAGNWSGTASHRITVDNVYPTLTGVKLVGPTHPDDTSTNVYTNSINVTVNITASVASEAGRPVTIEYYDYNPSGWKQWPTKIYSDNPSISVTLPSTNGERRVYVRLIDEAGNTTSYIYDTIILDTEDPVVSFSINDPLDAYTPSLSFYLNLDGTTDNISDASQLEVLTYHPYDGQGWNTENYRPFSTSLISDFQWPETAGVKYTRVIVRDAAGNASGSVYDNIILQVPEPTYAQKGKYSSGTSYVYFNPVTEPAGDYATRYYLYSTTEAGANPNDTLPSDWTYEYSTTSTTSIYSSIPKGEIRYFFIRAYNSDTGGYGPWTTTNTVYGFSSNITVVYGYDVSAANDIKSFLEDTYYSGGLASHPDITGTMPTWTVTLLHEDLISNTYSSDDTNRIYGDPIIITPDTSFEYNTSTYDGKVRNMAASGKGIIGMWLRGMYVLDRIERNWSSWGLTGTPPTQIGYKTPTETLKSYSNGNLNSMKKTAASASENIWHTPLSHNNLSAESTVTLTAFTTTINRWGANISGSVIDGYKYAASPSYPTRFPVVRQGRFMQYGYQAIPKDTTWRYSDVFFVNLIARMDNF